MGMQNSFATRVELEVQGRTYTIFSLRRLTAQFPLVDRLPFSLKILLENLLRREDGKVVEADDVRALATHEAATKNDEPAREIAFLPARVLLQDFTGVPAIADLAAMRDAIARLGGDAERINPLQPVDLVIDHSVQVDRYGTADALHHNAALEMARNRERYAFLRWGQQGFRNLRVIPPDTGICHQVNLEHLAKVVFTDADGLAYPDTLVGTDSHTTMINGLGVLGWGVGGIEAEAAMLGQPVVMLIPPVVGVKLHGKLLAGATATDLVLTVTQMLRRQGVVNKFVEFFGPGLESLSVADRATVANMAPEYGATMGFFAVDAETLAYLRFTQRPPELVALVEAYCKEQGLFREATTPDPSFAQVVDLDLASIVPSIAGPKRPQDRIALSDASKVVGAALAEMVAQRRPVKPGAVALGSRIDFEHNGVTGHLGHGDVVIAAITSCTNTSNPAVMIAAGLLAKKAVERGLTVKPWVKTSLAPGSQVVTSYLDGAGLTPYLEGLGFHLVGYGCTTCIGNSGPLPQAVGEAIERGDLVVASVLSGNRNFEGRINLQVRMNFLASPPLVVAFALCGRTGIDFGHEPVGLDRNGAPVFLREIWPSPQEINAVTRAAVLPEQFAEVAGRATSGSVEWRCLATGDGRFFPWDEQSTYVRQPPFFRSMALEPVPLAPIVGARALAMLGDSITTDHISPAGGIAAGSPAARYLQEHAVAPADFNSYGARRGNHEVMLRGTFANTRLRNLLAPDSEGGVTMHLPSNETMSIYDAAMRYQQDNTPLFVIAGAEYGTGSSRDWAAKGPRLLGVRFVLAKSFERIHRSNLIGMGILPLQFAPTEDAASLGLTGRELYDLVGLSDRVEPRAKVTVRVHRADGTSREFQAEARIDTPIEADYYQHGGILPFVLRQMLRDPAPAAASAARRNSASGPEQVPSSCIHMKLI